MGVALPKSKSQGPIHELAQNTMDFLVPVVFPYRFKEGALSMLLDCLAAIELAALANQVIAEKSDVIFGISSIAKKHGTYKFL